MNGLDALFAANDGAQIPGGCAHCDAVQVIHANYYGHGLHRIEIQHDDTCPWLQERTTE